MKVLLALTMLFACSVFTAHGKHPRTFTPGLEGSTVGNLTAHGCYSGWGTSRASMDRCCLLRACCYARLAARRCRVGPVQPPLAAARAGLPTCSECSPHGSGCPFPHHPLSRGALSRALGEGLRCAVGPRRVGDVVPARRLQVRAGGVAVPGSAPPGSAPPPRQVPGPGRALLKQNLPSQSRLRAEPRRDGAGSASQPWRASSSGLLGFEARTTTLR
ncbi:uncharacterized protein LOC104697581 isoform X1 [Corvus cornix cornix]|uniref:uncharacterized protein LOC104697581 isoform X1 n=1 Tax=Corvus cornix cornix TaxID=932674 RepID=UPI00194FB072|nr:uncharacterized protein LOC104697581 isoform X1 [Corvus cornix cornix]XP_039419756.1 uncharacterized protein LOC104697581 isoform X1 [Corvus cornix cornix]